MANWLTPRTGARFGGGGGPNTDEEQRKPRASGAFRYCRRQLFANALMAGLARRSWRAKGQSRRGIPARLEPVINTPERNS
jgi:hypothetical protein